jgi:hypothetical protein
MAFIFPIRHADGTYIPSAALGNRRQDNIFDTSGDYLGNDPLGLWILEFVELTDFGVSPARITESGGFIPASAFLPASYCGNCHKDVHRQWRESAHANSFREPFYLRNVEMLNNSKGLNPRATAKAAITRLRFFPVR